MVRMRQRGKAVSVLQPIMVQNAIEILIVEAPLQEFDEFIGA